jgi:tagaturonate reductase
VFDPADTFGTGERPAKTFPGKLTKFLYDRFKHFNGDETKGLTMLPVELIDNNGAELRRCVKEFAKLWVLGEAFENWLDTACNFTSTLVDRIVSGYPKDEILLNELQTKIGHKDDLMVTAELFGLWVIESEKDLSETLPLAKAGLPVVFTDNLKPYKERKVRILNGAHTSLCPIAYLSGQRFVRQSVEDDRIDAFVKRVISDEIIPTLSLPEAELKQFAADVLERFENPYIDHELFSISLNSVSKYRARCLPSVIGSIKNGKNPTLLLFALAALIEFYLTVDGVRDDEAVLDFFREARNGDTANDVMNEFLRNTAFFGEDIRTIDGVDIGTQVEKFMYLIREKGAYDALAEVLAE